MAKRKRATGRSARKSSATRARAARPAARRRARKAAPKRKAAAARRKTAVRKKAAVRKPASARRAAAKKPARKVAARKAAATRKKAKKPTRKAPPTRVAKSPARPRSTSPAPRPAAAAAAPGPEPRAKATRSRTAPVRQPIPSSLGIAQGASAARSGREDLRGQIQDHTETGPAITAGDLDANWALAYSSGDEAPGGDNPTPDQDVVDDIGHALGIEYGPTEELQGATKVEERDRHRWELDPASAEDYTDRRRDE
jgi:hypothetical protein